MEFLTNSKDQTTCSFMMKNENINFLHKKNAGIFVKKTGYADFSLEKSGITRGGGGFVKNSEENILLNTSKIFS